MVQRPKTRWHRRSSLVLLLAAILVPLLVALTVEGSGVLTLVAAVPVGGYPRAIVVDNWQGRNDVVFYDTATQHLRFLDGDSLTLVGDSVALPTWDFRPWLAYDRYHHRVYAVTTARRSGWVEVLAQAVSGRSLQATLSLNDLHNEGLPDPPDSLYAITGMVLDPTLSGSRIIVDCGRCGVIDALDLDAAGLAASARQRFQYRAALEGTIYTITGNSLARASGYLYLGDRPGATGHPGKQSVVDVFHQGVPPATFAPAAGKDIDLLDVWPFGNGYQSLVGSQSRLYVASGAASFATGYVAEIDAASGSVRRVIQLLYQDQAAVVVDWYDPRRLFVLTADDGWNDSTLPLYLHLIYDGHVVASLRLLEGYDSSDGAALAFDPYTNRLYVATGSSILVVRVDMGMAPASCATAEVGPLGGAVSSPDGEVTLRFAPGATSGTLTATLGDARPMDIGERVLVRGFEVTVTNAAGATLASTAQPYTVEVRPPSSGVSGTDPAAMGLYRWDGQAWVAVVSTTSHLTAPSTSTLAVVTRETGLFAVFGQPTWRFVPLALGARP